jgi:hypothetical protein
MTIAKTINGMDAQAIDAFKKNSLEAAKHLCWENESRKMIEAYEKVARKG